MPPGMVGTVRIIPLLSNHLALKLPENSISCILKIQLDLIPRADGSFQATSKGACDEGQKDAIDSRIPERERTAAGDCVARLCPRGGGIYRDPSRTCLGVRGSG